MIDRRTLLEALAGLLLAPVALAPLIIRWGEEASSDVLRRSARCARCGRNGASLTAPSW